MTIETVTRQRDAHGAICRDCDAIFNVSTCPCWHWSKSVAMHRSGAGHKVSLYVIVAPVPLAKAA